MFAALTLERDPLKWEDLPAALVSWTQIAGGFAAAGLALWILFYFFVLRTGPRRTSPPPMFLSVVFILGLAGAALAYGALGVLELPRMLRSLSESGRVAPPLSGAAHVLKQVLLLTGGASALVAVGAPFLVGLSRLRPRRIWALARLSFKEALRRRVLWAFSALLLVFLFAGWFIQSKPEDQLRTYVGVVFFVTTLLLLITGGVLASFSIPTDIRNQTIHTILTKPVEPFEVVLGRFLGYTLLMTLILVAATGLSLLYVLRTIDPDAAEETLKARVPVFGELHFAEDQGGRLVRKEGESVGREWDYRRYIPGPNPPHATQYAVWEFRAPPHPRDGQDTVRCEFTFDIFRTTKGRDDTKIACTFIFETWRFRREQLAKYNEERTSRRNSPGAGPIDVIDAGLAEEFGYYEAASVPIEDYHTKYVDVPAGLIRNALGRDDALREELQAGNQAVVPLRVRVRCEDRTQYVGMAKYDFYLRADDHRAGGDKLWFSWNFFKGAAGLWFRLCLVIGLAVALSTELSGVIGFLCGTFVYLAGVFQEFIQDLAFRRNIGGGPMESAIRLIKSAPLVTPLEDTAAAQVATKADVLSLFLLRVFLYVLPDDDLYNLTDYVAEGFSVSAGQLLLRLIFLSGYVLPWAVLAYYLIKTREIAGPT